MNLLIIGLLVIAIGVAFIRILKKNLNGESNIYIDLAYTLIGTFGGFIVAYSVADLRHSQQVRAHAIELIVSESTTASHAIEQLVQRIETEKLLRETVETNDDVAIQPAASSLNLPDMLKVFMNDGALYKALSKPFQERLPIFVTKLDTYDEVYKVYNDPDTEIAHTGTYSLVILELRTQRECLKLELEYLKGMLGKSEHESRFAQILDSQANYLKEGASEHFDFDKTETRNAPDE